MKPFLGQIEKYLQSYLKNLLESFSHDVYDVVALCKRTLCADLNIWALFREVTMQNHWSQWSHS